MTHVLYNVIQSMGHGQFIPHDLWIVWRFSNYHFSMTHELYNVIQSMWIIQVMGNLHFISQGKVVGSESKLVSTLYNCTESSATSY